MARLEAVGTIVADLDKRILEVDDTYVEIAGWDRRELIGRSALSFTHRDDLDVNQPALDALAHGGRSFHITKRYVRHDGTIVWVQNSVGRVEADGRTPVITARARVITRPFAAVDLATNYDVARRLCAFMIGGREAVGSLFSAPMVEIFLHLYREEIEATIVTVDELASRIACSTEVTVRWVRALEQKGLIELEEAGASQSLFSVRICRRCEEMMDGMLAKLLQPAA